MSLKRIAGKYNINVGALKDLNNGSIRESISKKLGVSTFALQNFIDGNSSSSLAAKIEISTSNLQKLRDRIGKQGAIGLIVGLLIRERKYFNGYSC